LRKIAFKDARASGPLYQLVPSYSNTMVPQLLRPVSLPGNELLASLRSPLGRRPSTTLSRNGLPRTPGGTLWSPLPLPEMTRRRARAATTSEDRVGSGSESVLGVSSSHREGPIIPPNSIASSRSGYGAGGGTGMTSGTRFSQGSGHKRPDAMNMSQGRERSDADSVSVAATLGTAGTAALSVGVPSVASSTPGFDTYDTRWRGSNSNSPASPSPGFTRSSSQSSIAWLRSPTSKSSTTNP